jgi:hypothetical protein
VIQRFAAHLGCFNIYFQVFLHLVLADIFTQITGP